MATAEERQQQLREMIPLQTTQHEAANTTGSDGTSLIAIKYELGGHCTLDETKHVLKRARWQRTMVEVVVHDENLLCGNGTEAG